MEEKLENFFAYLKTASNRLLLLDYDGTMAPFRKERDKAIPYDGIEERLDMLIASKSTRVVIISGRAISDLKPLLRLRQMPEIWGSHGWETLKKDGSYNIRKADESSIRGLKAAREFIMANNLGQYLEEKPVSIAVHYRGIEKNKALEIRDKISHNWNELRNNFSLTYSDFDGGLELRIPGFNKGNVVRDIIAGHERNSAVAYLGDDLTDEDAFKALPDKALGILVAATQRPTAASVRIEPPKGVIEFFDRWIEIERTA